MKRLLLLGILALCFIEISSAHAQVMSDYCITPAFINTVVKPNVLVILDNSNSMDEDFYGNAAGSFNSTDKLVIGKKALIDIITRFKDNLRLGVASFKVGTGVAADYIHNSPYFVSYQLKSYCPNPPPECLDWCKNGTVASQTTCSTVCQAQNASFDSTYFDEIITANALGSATRNKYCELVYPKTQVKETPSNPGIFWYYKQALPMYGSGSNYGTAHCYSGAYSSAESAGATSSYSVYRQKTDSSDANSGYSTLWFNSAFVPTDSDIAAGYMNFGRRMSWYYISRTWFKNSSAGDGYIHVSADDLVNASGTNTATFTNVIAKLDPKEGNEAGYMSCGNSDKDTCPYIIAAGLTPTAGTFQTAINYFQGASSPIQYTCQTNYIIFVTDGLPSVNESGGLDTANNLMPGVLGKITALRSATKTLAGVSYPFDIKSYILGVGLTQDAKAKLDLMAQGGGTADAGGHAYYADNPTAMSDALTQIFEDVVRRVSSGTAASVLASSEGSGANIAQAVFYPKRLFEGTEATWTGELINLWYYIDPQLTTSTIREDTVEGSTPDTERTLNLEDDYVINYTFDPVTNTTRITRMDDTTGHGGPYTVIDSIPLESVKYIWSAGQSLFNNPPSSRDIRYGKKSGSLWLIDDFETGNFTSPTDPNLNNTFAGDPTTTQIIDYVWGTDSPAFRNRTVTVNGVTGVWKLGDIVSSTPRIQSTFALNSYHQAPPDGYNDTTYLSYISTNDPTPGKPNYRNRGMVYAGANDGMLHAFYLGKLQSLNSGVNVAKLTATTGNQFGEEKWAYIPHNALPYLKYLLSKDYCHLFYVDGPVTIVDASVSGATKTSASWKTILIGGMGMGGACEDRTATCSGLNCVNIPKDDIGYSSYFALDVTDQNDPKLLWEFTDPGLGFSTSGPAIVRVGNKGENGTWMVVFASGPTGPIDTSSFHQFLGRSDQNLKLFVRNLYTGLDMGTIDTGIVNGFGGSLYNATLDLEKGKSYHTSNYQDDVLYLGYTTNTEGGDIDTTWSKGGVLRVVTNNSATVTDWSTSKFIKGIGPVTSAVTKLHDTSNYKLWLHFGTGRFYYRRGADLDDKTPTPGLKLYGVKDPCYGHLTGHTACTETAYSDIVPDATTFADQSGPTLGSMTGKQGWFIDLAATAGDFGAERVVTDPLAVFSGAVFFTTFSPAADVCSLGGNSALWAVKYDTGGPVSLEGKALMQISTGEVKQIDLATAFTDRAIDSKGRRTAGFKGMPPRGQGLSVVLKPKALRKILQMKEK